MNTICEYTENKYDLNVHHAFTCLLTLLFLCVLPLQAYYGHCEALRLLSETLVSLDVRDIEGRTALYLAAQRGFAPCVEVLLKHEASYTLKEHKHKWTALHAAGVCVCWMFKDRIQSHSIIQF